MKWVIFLSVLVLSGGQVFADANTGDFSCERKLEARVGEVVVAAVEKRYGGISGLSAKFVQHSYFLGLDETVQSAGRVYFRKPGMMDWQYDGPEKQRFVADGRTLWFYQPELNQVTMAEFKDSFDSELPVSFLLGVGSLRESFQLKVACENKEGLVLRLEPKELDPNLAEFLLLVSAKEKKPMGAKVVDMGGNQTTIKLIEPVLDEKLSKEQFTFSIPLGVDVIDQRAE